MDKLILPVRKQLVLPRHHSLADWDLQPGAYFFLDTWTYISEPKCLALPSTTTSKNYYGWVALKAAIDGNIPHGAIAGYFYRGTTLQGTLYLFCRAQALPPGVGQPAYPANCYYMTTNYQQWILRKRVNNVETTLSTINVPTGSMQPQQWQLYQFLWGTESTPGGDVCRFTFKLEQNGQWVQMATYDHSENLWPATGIALVGFNMGGNGLNPSARCRADDTAIWKRNY